VRQEAVEPLWPSLEASLEGEVRGQGREAGRQRVRDVPDRRSGVDFNDSL
jgi:hypothetical protein